jgi:predicted ATPase/DNA-binding XRE family transcriptional regulator
MQCWRIIHETACTKANARLKPIARYLNIHDNGTLYRIIFSMKNNVMTQQSFGQVLKHRRKALDMTQAELAEKLGCALVTISRLETNQRRPSRQVAERLAHILSIPAAEHSAFLYLARTPSASILPQEDPPQPDAQTNIATRLPIPLTPLVGRAAMLHDIAHALQRSDVRLLTLIGPPGVGKSRLALQIAAQAQYLFADGVSFVALAPVHDHTLVLATIAQTLGIVDDGRHSRVTQLQQALHDRQLLLVLDNFEHVTLAAPTLVDLLSAAPALKLLVTSRVALHISGEHLFSVSPLELPDLDAPPNVEDLLQIGAVELFVQRAQAASHTFQLTPMNANAVRDICLRLDGLPLALELAAARCRLLSPQNLLLRLTQRLALLTHGAQDRPVHQRTLRDSIAWSYELLAPQEQQLWRQLGVCVNGWSLEAAEALAMPYFGRFTPEVVLNSIAALLDHSLIQQNFASMNEPRYTMLETLREFALEQLVVTDQERAARHHHALYYHALVEQAAPGLWQAKQIDWLNLLETEHDNFRAALNWLLSQHEIETAARLASGLWRFWETRSYLTEGYHWLCTVLQAPEALSRVTYAQVLLGAGVLAMHLSNYDEAITHLHSSMQICRQLNDHEGEAFALQYLGVIAYRKQDDDQAHLLLTSSLAQAQQAKSALATAGAFYYFGVVSIYQGDYLQADAYLSDALALHRMLGNTMGIAKALISLGIVARSQGDYTYAQNCYQESLVFFQQLKNLSGVAHVYGSLADLALIQGYLDNAKEWYLQSIALGHTLGAARVVIDALIDLSRIAFLQEDYMQAAHLLDQAEKDIQVSGDRWFLHFIRYHMGRVAFQQGEIERAIPLLHESLVLSVEFDDKEQIAHSLEICAALAIQADALPRAVVIYSAAASVRKAIGTPLQPIEQANHIQLVENLQLRLAPDEFAASWACGQAMTLEQAVAYVVT